LTGYKNQIQVTPAAKLANEFRVFYTRFERSPCPPPCPCPSRWDLVHNHEVPFREEENTAPQAPAPFDIEEKDVYLLFCLENGVPDGISPANLKLAPVITNIFNQSIVLCKVKGCLKSSTIIPVPKKNSTVGLNDYRP